MHAYLSQVFASECHSGWGYVCADEIRSTSFSPLDRVANMVRERGGGERGRKMMYIYTCICADIAGRHKPKK